MLLSVCSSLQAHVCQLGLNSVLAALQNHPDDTDIQAKGLVVLGVLGQVGGAYHVTGNACSTCNKLSTLFSVQSVLLLVPIRHDDCLVT